MTGYLLEAARWTLALVFAVSVASKLVLPDGVGGLATTLRRGLRIPAADLAARALVAAEAVVAVLLMVPATVTAGLAAAAVLTVALTGGTAVLARRAEAVPCHCFGTSSSVVTWWSVARNAALTAAAIGALALHQADSDRADASLAVSLAAVVTAVAVLLVVRWMAIIRLRLRQATRAGGEPVTLPPNGPDLGSIAPAAAAPEHHRVRPRLVAFASASCEGCRLSLPRLMEYAGLVGDRERVVVAIVGELSEGADIAATVSEVARVAQGKDADAMATAFGVVLFPTYVLVTDDGLVEAVTLSVDELPRLVR